MAASHRGLLLALIVALPACQVVLDLKTAVLDPEGAGGGGAGPCEPATQGACYDGPAETKDIGECEGGTRACGEDGSLGVCEGQSLPQPETCASTKDENCDGFDCALWNRIYGDLAWQLPLDIAVDSSGAVYLHGGFSGTILFAGRPVIASGAAESFLAKLGPDGDEQWLRPLGALLGKIAVDASGNVVFAGGAFGTANLGGQDLVNAGGQDVVIGKLDTDGKHLWSRAIGGMQDDTVSDVAVSPSGNVVVAGSFTGSVDFGDQGLSSVGGSKDLFVVALNGLTGDTMWSKSYGDDQEQPGALVAVDSVGNIVLTGDYYGAFGFGGQTLPDAGTLQAGTFVAKLDGDGEHAWSGRLCPNVCPTSAIAVDGTGSVVLAGTFTGEADFGPQTLSTAGGQDLFLVKLGAGKTYQWGLRFGDKTDEGAPDVAVNSDGQIAFAAPFDGTLSLGGDIFMTEGHTDIVVGKISPGGNHVWSRRFGDDSHQNSPLVHVQPSGEVALTLAVSGAVNFGAGFLTAAGNEVGETDIAVVKLGR